MLELGPGADGELFLVVHLPHWEELIHVVERARRIAGLDLDVDEASGHLARDRIIGRLVRARPGIRVPGTWDPFEIGVRAIVGQQVSARGANTLVSRLVAAFGEDSVVSLVNGLVPRVQKGEFTLYRSRQ